MAEVKDVLLMLLKDSLQKNRIPELQTVDCDWGALIETAQRHGVISLLYEALRKQKLEEGDMRRATQLTRTVVRQNYRLLVLTHQLLELFGQNGIPVVLLKGMGTASFYPVAELRKSGDIDLLLLDAKKLDAAGDCLKTFGCRVEEWQPSLHHIVFRSPAGDAKIEIELHTMLAEPFDNQSVNVLLQEQVSLCSRQLTTVSVAGVELTILDTACHGYELLLHMLQHFLRSGFGLKLLCDWVVFWNRETDEEQQNRYLELVGECGIKKFSDLVTLTCIEYLGLPAGRVAFMDLDRSLDAGEFMQEILEAEEFGKSSRDRMVALRGNSISDYVREFHHQMHLNYPAAGKWVVLWPVLWGMTLLRFLVNNRRVRHISLFSVMKKAGQRGKIIKKLQLFK